MQTSEGQINFFLSFAIFPMAGYFGTGYLGKNSRTEQTISVPETMMAT